MQKTDFVKAKSTIAINTSKGVKAIQVYYNGTFELMGNKLLKHYSKWQNTIRMMGLGTLVVLGDNLKAFGEDNKDGTLDLVAKGKEKEPCKVYEDLARLIEAETDSEFMYYWDKDRWYGMQIENGKPYASGGLCELTALV